MAGVADGVVFDERGVKAEELGFANLLGVAEKLVAIAESGVPSAVEFAASGLALDDEKGNVEIVSDEDVRTTAAGAVAEFPFWL